MEYKNLVNSFVRSWNFTRSETLELLQALTDKQLLYKPKGVKWQSLAYQFGCIGRTQMIYTRAIEQGIMDFSWFADKTIPSKNDFVTGSTIKTYLEEADNKWSEAVREKRREEDFLINWPGFNRPLTNHIAALMTHERMHHGQIISYYTLADIELPLKFKTNWAL